jgi:hypothetical protein
MPKSAVKIGTNVSTGAVISIDPATWVVLDPATAANQPIMLTATGDPTLGDGTVRVRAWYVVHDTTLPS